MDTKVSIIIPVYNAEKSISETMDSLINQTYRNLEIICVDDGSSDNSVSKINEYIKKDSRIVLLQQKNQYAGIARNNGLAHASGDYVMFLDSDDVFEKNMVKYLVKKSKKYDPDIITFGYWRFVDSIKRRRPVKNRYKDGMVCSPAELKTEIFQITRSLPWDKFLKMSFVQKTGLQYQGTKVNNDIFFNRTIVTAADKLLFLKKRLVNYRINNTGSLQGKLNKNPTDFITGNLGIAEELQRRGTIDEFRDSFDRMILGDVLAHFRRANSLSEFEIIAKDIEERKFFETMGICKDNEAIMKHPYKDMFLQLLDGNVSESLFSLYSISRDNSVGKESFEYTVGHKLMKMLRLTY